MTNTRKRIALITGASKGLGKALATVLADRGWTLLLTARGADSLSEVADALGAQHLAGDVADPEHRARLAAEVARLGGLDLLVNNAGSLGPTPLPRVADFPLRDLSDMFDVNVVAPTALIQATL
ncbi:MAG: SDR family NAD(P)-dependent oxidoreductase, partial [Stackebrandtia sp.]